MAAEAGTMAAEAARRPRGQAWPSGTGLGAGSLGLSVAIREPALSSLLYTWAEPASLWVTISKSLKI